MVIVNFTNVPNNVDFSKSFIYQTSAGVAIDLTGSTLYMMVRTSPAAANPPLVSLSSPSTGITITNAVQGKFQIQITRAALAAIPVGIYVHDLIRLRPDTLEEQVWSGSLTITSGVYR